MSEGDKQSLPDLAQSSSLIAQSPPDGAQPLGLVPLYPFPQITQPHDGTLAKNSFPNFGFSFLPPIHQRALHYRTKVYFSDNELRREAQAMLEEVVTEEALDLLEETISFGVKPSPRAPKQHARRRKDEMDRLSKVIFQDILGEVLSVECRQSVVGYFDDIISSHRQTSEENQLAVEIFKSLEMEVLQEIAEDVIDVCLCGEICLSIIHEFVYEETSALISEVLMHYGARVAFSQYKQITKRASDLVLDGASLQTLLPRPPVSVMQSVVDRAILDVLIGKSLEMRNRVFPGCATLQWFKRKVVLRVAMDTTLDELCATLDEQLR